MIALKLPELGENIDTAEVSRLLVAEGDVIEAEQSVMELDSEKASFPLPCPHAGKVAKIHVKEGDTVKVGQTVLEIEETGTAGAPPAEKRPPAAEEERKAPPKAEEKEPARPKAAEKKEPSRERPKEPPKKREAARAEKARPDEKAREGEEREKAAPEEKAPPEKLVAKADKRPPAPAGPATRKLARELGVNLHEVEGSEPDGRVTRDDVKAYVQRRMTATQDLEAPPLPEFSRWGPVKRQRLNQVARTSAQRLSLAWRLVPHVTQHELADITELEAARQRFNQNSEQAKPKITVTVLALQGAVAALRAYPQFNSSFDPAAGELIVKEYYHLGVAVDTEQGLLVPVIRDADRKTMVQLAAELADLADKARNRSLTRKEMEGGTFTITNLGGIGGTAFTPIINYPEVAILGVAQARWQQVSHDGRKAATRLLLPLSLSYDHRVINGADGARFLGKVAELLSGAFRLLAES
jgi:pyruvate dehydrogenase E2 component (dihydrolipoamide acetyltransferase)